MVALERLFRNFFLFCLFLSLVLEVYFSGKLFATPKLVAFIYCSFMLFNCGVIFIQYSQCDLASENPTSDKSSWNRQKPEEVALPKKKSRWEGQGEVC